MGKKKRGHPNIEELLSRPWCYYCERDFEDLKLLISHQKAKHFKCDRCGRRLNTAGGLSVHMNQVHKESLALVENALPNRQGLDVEIFGMEGLPEEVRKQHEERIVKNYFDAQRERFEATGNPPPGEGRPTKKIKIETPEELKKRFAEFRAKKAAAKAAGLSGAPVPAPGNAQSPGQTGSPGTFVSLLHEVDHYQPSFPAYAPQNSPFNPPQAYSQPGYPNYPANAAPPSAGYGQYSTTNLPARPPSLPTAPNLPQRPGHPANYYPGQAAAGAFAAGGASTVDELVGGARHGDDIDQLIRMAEAGIKPGKTTTEGAAPGPDSGEKKSKKEKGRMIYSDAEYSPEEKMAMMPRYQWQSMEA
ncbi:hypothetical protein BD289DRAFT_378085 [Coniella lustricola]|uniref:C2H2-type domain-containing protein n=1 Tax=Coniella lustricola TaxID=2025994 RepID=A0A2T2ZUK7_9PEZI|nr:hypothetical protein BD289DRAFT_378085 [Coniella lustricola]